MRAAGNETGGDHTTGHGTDLGGHKHGADLGHADDLFALLGREHAGHRCLQLVDRVVNDVVVMDLHTIAFGQLARAGIGPHIEADDDGLGRNRQVDVGLADTTHRRVDHLHLDLFGGEFEQGRGQRFLGTLYIGLDDDGQHLDIARGHIGKHRIQLGCLLLGQLGIAELTGTVGRDFTGTPLVGHDHELVTRLGHFGQALNFHGDRRTGGFRRFAVLIQHGAHAAVSLACQHHIAGFERAGLNQHGRHRATALVQLGLDHQALGQGVHRRAQLQYLGLQQDLLQ